MAHGGKGNRRTSGTGIAGWERTIVPGLSRRARARVEGTHHIPLGSLVERLDEVPRDRTVYVMCAVGGRSARATQYLEQQGIDAVNIDGGIAEWHRSGLPVTIGGAA